MSESLQDGSFCGFELLNEVRCPFHYRVSIFTQGGVAVLVIDAFRAGAEAYLQDRTHSGSLQMYSGRTRGTRSGPTATNCISSWRPWSIHPSA